MSIVGVVKTGSKSIGLDHCTHQPRFQALTSILPDTGQVATWPEFLRVFFGWWNMVEPQGVGFLVTSTEEMPSSELRKDEEPKIVAQLC